MHVNLHTLRLRTLCALLVVNCVFSSAFYNIVLFLWFLHRCILTFLIMCHIIAADQGVEQQGFLIVSRFLHSIVLRSNHFSEGADRFSWMESGDMLLTAQKYIGGQSPSAWVGSLWMGNDIIGERQRSGFRSAAVAAAIADAFRSRFFASARINVFWLTFFRCEPIIKALSPPVIMRLLSEYTYS